MKRRIMGALCALIFALTACSGNAPQTALDEMASALETRDAAKFLSRVDMQLYAANYVASITEGDQALRALNSLSGLLGLGNLDNLLSGVINFRERIRERFDKGVANGELVAQCEESLQSGCPWIPKALRNARVTLIDKDAAIAEVASPRGIITWLAFRKDSDVWKLVGLASLESEARIYAKGAPQKMNHPSGEPAPQNEESAAAI